MIEDDSVPASCGRKPRSDGVHARERILASALRLFAERGYASTSVRELAQAADANVAAIAYYFGDKAGLYRAALYEPLQRAADADLPTFDAPGLALREALARFLRNCLQPLDDGPAALLSVRLRLREAFEPTGMLEEERTSRERLQRRLRALLARELGLPAPDPDLHALTFSIWALVTYPYIGHEHIARAAPGLFDAPGALDAWVARLAAYACAMVDAERARRAAAPACQPDSQPTGTPR
ncbi:TetR/AcrR family transcriptional regulator [uncultured Massilia sp.]|uniref:TetR/AcrR family transcriptional regulator n=1 Tax=uncultured Massilia sp. TaxID=169973 RepID=UPI0025E16615|nr:CerR family C-terminal domain-containing protein [uncultured Massilia sp.]